VDGSGKYSSFIQIGNTYSRKTLYGKGSKEHEHFVGILHLLLLPPIGKAI
jgi:hypothetical protein